jgi:hypothetical protein
MREETELFRETQADLCNRRRGGVPMPAGGPFVKAAHDFAGFVQGSRRFESFHRGVETNNAAGNDKSWQ